MKTKTEIEIGQRVIVLNKFNDEIADGNVTDVLSNGFQLTSDGEDIHVASKNIVSVNGNVVSLNVAC